MLLALPIASANAASAKKPAEGQRETVQILFTSDIHGTFLSHNYATGKDTVGSLSKIATVAKKLRADFKGTTIMIDNGDAIQGNGTGFFINNKDYSPFPIVKGFNLIGYDYAELGNHEFNFGIPAMLQAYKGFKGQVLCGNVVDAKGDTIPGVKPYAIKTLPSGLRIAFIGSVSPNIDLWDTNNLKKAGLVALSASETTRKIIDELKAKDLADIFVASSHMGNTGEYGREGSGAIDVIAKCPELAVFLGAHYHTAVGTKDKQVVVDNAVKFVENKNAGETLGQVLLTATYTGGRWVVADKTSDYDKSDVKTDVIPITAETPQDPQFVAAFAKEDEAARSYITTTVIGKLAGGPLVPEPQIAGTYEGYLQDTPLADLINNVMIKYTGAQISGTAPLDTNSNCQPGDITIGGVVQIYKYDNNTLYKVKMTGAQVVEWMEWAHSYFGSTIDGKVDNSKPAVNLATDLTIPTGTMQGYNQDQFAGIKYTVDLTKPVGGRIKVLSMADGSPFDTNKSYVVAVNNYRATTQLLATSPTGVFKPGEKTAELIQADVQDSNGQTSMMDLIIDYIKHQPDATIKNTCDHNWEFVNLNWNKDMRQKAIEAINGGKIVTDFKQPVTIDEVKKAYGIK